MKLYKISKDYAGSVIFDGLNAELPSRGITTLIGASGVGKTSLLNIISGLTDYTGTIDKDETVAAYIFAEQALIPNLSVSRNLGYVLKGIITDKVERQAKIYAVLRSMGLEDAHDKYPAELSTGMAQRVSIARAFIYPADYILMDEPFRGLDIGLKSRLIKLFLEQWEKDKKTVLNVTHDVNEALLLSDKIIFLGGSPARILLDEDITVPRGERNLTNPHIAALAARITDVFSREPQ